MVRLPLIQNVADRVFARMGYSRIPETDQPTSHPDMSEEDMRDILAVEGLTMTSMERRYHLVQAVRHITKHKIPGALVECGVWRGGSMMLMAQTLIRCRDESRDLYLYDTFEGMPPPTEVDKDFGDRPAIVRMNEHAETKASSPVWAIAGLDEVRRHMESVGYPVEKTHYIVGNVEITIPSVVPPCISLLRLDTDWYDSTAHELRHLYPLVAPGGVVIIDDYGYWQGARKAVDEFISNSTDRILLHRIDNTGRAFVKP